jgi:hypothetical protein
MQILEIALEFICCRALSWLCSINISTPSSISGSYAFIERLRRRGWVIFFIPFLYLTSRYLTVTIDLHKTKTCVCNRLPSGMLAVIRFIISLICMYAVYDQRLCILVKIEDKSVSLPSFQCREIDKRKGSVWSSRLLNNLIHGSSCNICSLVGDKELPCL